MSQSPDNQSVPVEEDYQKLEDAPLSEIEEAKQRDAELEDINEG